jgi:hypothetical protein
MKIPFIALVVSLCACGIARAESTIYKCTKPDGSTVFSPSPCGKGAQEIGVPKAANSSNAPSTDAIRDISDSVADSRCRDAARQLYVEPDRSAIVNAENEIKRLQSRAWTGDPNQAQQMASDDATRVVGLRNVIATERAHIDVQRTESRKRVDDALARCDEQKRERDAHRGK